MSTAFKSPLPILRAIYEAGVATAEAVGTSRAHLNELAAHGLIVEAGPLRTGKRGRPAATFRVTKKGADAVRRA
jgi:predicted ArsR family transcriptional regulator